MRDAIYDRLNGDPLLAGLLTGGLYTRAEINRQETPDVFDANGEISPCGLLKLGTTIPELPFPNGQRLFFDVLLYERSGSATIEQAQARVYELLHRQKVTPASGGCWQIRHTSDVQDLRDEALNCSLIICRYEAVYNRE
jgi:hypothetical protein